MDELSPVDYTVNVPLAPAAAFELFTRSMRRWWPLSSHSCGGAEASDVIVEPRVGGRIVESTTQGAAHVWGTILEWTPPDRLVTTWHPGTPVDQATRLQVTFTARDRSTDVRILHDGWAARGEQAAARRQAYDEGWRAVMAHYESAARLT